MDWIAFSIFMGLLGLVCGVGFCEKLAALMRGSGSND